MVDKGSWRPLHIHILYIFSYFSYLPCEYGVWHVACYTWHVYMMAVGVNVHNYNNIACKKFHATFTFEKKYYTTLRTDILTFLHATYFRQIQRNI